jgi:hypothetical protein
VFSTEEDSIQTTCSLLAADLTWQSRSDRSLTEGGRGFRCHPNLRPEEVQVNPGRVVARDGSGS